MSDKYKVLIFFGLLLTTILILSKLCIDTKSLIVNGDILNLDIINTLQKKISIINIISFSILTIYSLWLYTINKSINYLIMSLMVFIGITLFINVSISKLIYSTQGRIPSEEGGYWLIVFIGIFYIIGAILVATIGYLSIKNYTKRYMDKNNITKSRKYK